MASKPKVPLTAKTYEHPTPDDLFIRLSLEFGPFDYDPATRAEFFTARHVRRYSTLAGTFQGDGFPLECMHGLGDELTGYRKISDADGLSYPWRGRVFTNPPYGRDLWRWVKRAHDSVRQGDAEIVVALLPVRADLRWWHKYVMREARRASPLLDLFDVSAEPGHEPADIVRFEFGRTRYGSYDCSECGHEHAESACDCGCIAGVDRHRVNVAQAGAPFPSAVVVWRKP